jgi:hypothetical protein
MVDPITTGALVASALSLGAKAVEVATGEATKDAYKALKAKVTRWASSEVAALEKTPESGARQAVLAEIIDNRPKEDQQAARELAEAVLKHLEGGGTNVSASGNNAIAAGRDVSGNTIIRGNRNVIR